MERECIMCPGTVDLLQLSCGHWYCPECREEMYHNPCIVCTEELEELHHEWDPHDRYDD